MLDHLLIMIVDRNEIQGEGLRRILVEQSFDVAGVYRNLDSLPPLRGHGGKRALFIIDAATDDCTMEMCFAVRARYDDALIVMMGENCHSHVVAKAFCAGIDGYIDKGTSCASFVEMIKLVALGEKFAPSQVIFDLANFESQMRRNEAEARIDDANISAREIEILRGLIQGDPNKIISRRLNISEATVKVHVKSILRKLHVANRTQAAIWALSRGLGGDVAAADEPKPKPHLTIVDEPMTVAAGSSRSVVASANAAARVVV
jgi:two-component system nitrate/nitrite response regulator NarL